MARLCLINATVDYGLTSKTLHIVLKVCSFKCLGFVMCVLGFLFGFFSFLSHLRKDDNSFCKGFLLNFSPIPMQIGWLEHCRNGTQGTSMNKPVTRRWLLPKRPKRGMMGGMAYYSNIPCIYWACVHMYIYLSSVLYRFFVCLFRLACIYIFCRCVRAGIQQSWFQ